ncbi:hypothetical protein LB941_01880 [Ligilactobacillus sp. WILCCON 0076]|uniref:Uncharacterized protein n=1 Tax=Ligilactobacillus ubinensis TaxID=2876789 RepID=A0A9X2FKM3_9LACO|nr:hypothetical protein [Ligilactobacillus ubinensis]MCP0886083.1 hypothetical protein [Ligilactobacillus ubinensis]
MSKSVRNWIWTLTAVVLIIFSDWWIKSDVASRIVNIIGCLILMKQLMKMFQHGSKKVVFWQIVGVAAFLAAILIDLILLSI